MSRYLAGNLALRRGLAIRGSMISPQATHRHAGSSITPPPSSRRGTGTTKFRPRSQHMVWPPSLTTNSFELILRGAATLPLGTGVGDLVLFCLASRRNLLLFFVLSIKRSMLILAAFPFPSSMFPSLVPVGSSIAAEQSAKGAPAYTVKPASMSTSAKFTTGAVTGWEKIGRIAAPAANA